MQILTAPRLQGAGAVDHGIHAAEQRTPVLRPDHAIEVGVNGRDLREAPGEPLRIAHGRADLMAVGQEPRQHPRSDEAVRAEKEDAHRSANHSIHLNIRSFF
jgi:hypothetical protein